MDINTSFRGIKNYRDDKVKKIEYVINNMNLDVGDYKWSVNLNDFKGWLLCNGRALLRSEYPELFNVIGTSFGSTSGSNFKLPDMRGRAFGGVGTSGNGGDAVHALGHSVGAENVTLSTTQIPSHQHNGTTNARVTGITSNGTTDNGTTGVTVNSVGGHTHTYNDAYFAEHLGGGGNFGTSAGTDTDNAFVWRTASGGYSTSPQDLNTGVSGGHSHTLTDGGHTHTFTANITDPSHTHEFTTNATGGGESHPNIQPTLYAGNLFIFSNFKPEVY